MMKVRKAWIGSKKPVMQGKLVDIQKIFQGLVSKQTGEELLDLMKSIDKRLKKLEDIPARMAAVENDVFKLKLQR